MRGLLKILRVQKALTISSAIADLQMRLNLCMHFINDAIWYTMQILLFEVLYQHVGHFGGWGQPEIRLFLGMLFFIDALQMVLFHYNFDQFSERVVRGDLDLLLIKPTNTLHLMSCQRVSCGFILNALLAAGWLGWSLSLLPGGITVARLAGLLIAIPAGLTVFFATRLFFNTFALLFSRAEVMHECYFTLFKLAQRPDRLYSPGLRYVVLLLMPVGMIASVPTRVVVDPWDPLVFWGLLGVALGSFLIAISFWNWSLRYYTSASS